MATIENASAFNRFGDSPEHRKAVIASGGRWVQVLYTSGQGTPQLRDILAYDGETAEEAAAGLLKMKGFENEKIIAAGEEGVDLSVARFAALLT